MVRHLIKKSKVSEVFQLMENSMKKFAEYDGTVLKKY